jgi:hypothetical protein
MARHGVSLLREVQAGFHPPRYAAFLTQPSPSFSHSPVTERPERTARGYRRFRCRACGKQYNERSGGLLNHTHYPSDVIALVVLWRLRYRLTLRDLAEMFLVRGLVFSHEAVRGWEAKLAPALADCTEAGGGAAGAAPVAATGTSPRRTSRSGADGRICIVRSTATAISSTPC